MVPVQSSPAHNDLLLALHRADSLEPIADKPTHKRKQRRHSVCLLQSAKPGIVTLYLRRAQLCCEGFLVLLQGMNAKLTLRHSFAKALFVPFQFGDLALVVRLCVESPLRLGDGVEKPRDVFVCHGSFPLRWDYRTLALGEEGHPRPCPREFGVGAWVLPLLGAKLGGVILSLSG